MLKKLKAWADKLTYVIVARCIALSGMITTLVGTLDFSPLWSLFSTGTDFTWKQLVFIGVSIIGAGVTIEMARKNTSKL